jgi:ferredoxin hydrogenase large subunit
MIKIDYEKCCWKDGKCSSCSCSGAKCVGCAEACPTQAITRGKLVEINQNKCLNCGACVAACKYGAVSLE